MQNFMEIGPVVFAGEYLGMKIGCSSYNTSKPVVDQTCYHTITPVHTLTLQSNQNEII